MAPLCGAESVPCRRPLLGLGWVFEVKQFCNYVYLFQASASEKQFA